MKRRFIKLQSLKRGSTHFALIEDILDHLSRKSSCQSAKVDPAAADSPEKGRQDARPPQKRYRKLSYQGDYTSGNYFCEDARQSCAGAFFEQSKINFKNIMEIRKEMGVYMRNSRTEGNVNVNSLINYVNRRKLSRTH